MVEISPGEIGAFRHGVRRHQQGQKSGHAYGDCCLAAGMSSAAVYRHGNLLKLLEPPPDSMRCPHTEQLGFNRSLYWCLGLIHHSGDHTLALVERLA